MGLAKVLDAGPAVLWDVNQFQLAAPNAKLRLQHGQSAQRAQSVAHGACVENAGETWPRKATFVDEWLWVVSHVRGRPWVVSGGVVPTCNTRIAEAQALARAHVAARGGNAALMYRLTQVQLIDNTYKNHVDALLSLQADVVKLSTQTRTSAE